MWETISLEVNLVRLRMPFGSAATTAASSLVAIIKLNKSKPKPTEMTMRSRDYEEDKSIGV